MCSYELCVEHQTHSRDVASSISFKPHGYWIIPVEINKPIKLQKCGSGLLKLSVNPLWYLVLIDIWWLVRKKGMCLTFFERIPQKPLRLILNFEPSLISVERFPEKTPKEEVTRWKWSAQLQKQEWWDLEAMVQESRNLIYSFPCM